MGGRGEAKARLYPSFFASIKGKRGGGRKRRIKFPKRKREGGERAPNFLLLSLPIAPARGRGGKSKGRERRKRGEGGGKKSWRTSHFHSILVSHPEARKEGKEKKRGRESKEKKRSTL